MPLEFVWFGLVWDFNRRAEVSFGFDFEFRPKLAVTPLLFLSLTLSLPVQTDFVLISGKL